MSATVRSPMKWRRPGVPPAATGPAAALTLGGLLSAAATPAFAEVCDKVSPDWQRGDGPVGLLGPALMVALVAVLLLGWRTGSAWIAFPATAACLLLALVSAADLIGGSALYDAATAEGCRAATRDLRDAAAFAALAAAFIYAWGRRCGPAPLTDNRTK